MSLKRILRIMQKDLSLGPRSPIFLWAFVYPFVITLVVQVVFGSLFAPKPRLGIVDEGNSHIAILAAEMEGIDLTLLNSVSELKRQLRDNDLDAGLRLKKGFDQAVRFGEKPLLEMWIGGESLASNRIVLAITTLDMIRGVEGKTPPVEVKIHNLGDEESLSISTRLIPLMVLLALIMAGVFVTAFGLVEERENKTLNAVLVTPVRFSEILLAKAAIGAIMAILLALVTLLLNGAVGHRLVALLIALFIAAIMSVEFGLIYGTAAKDTKTLFTLFKTLNLFIIAPVIFYLFPNWPQWIARIFPTYWIINPIFEIVVKDLTLGDVAFDLVIAICIIIVLVLPLFAFGRIMRSRLLAV